MSSPISSDLAAAFGIASSPGVYALLLGSGISRSAGIPTGWEVVLDLIRLIAAVANVDPVPDPVEWYEGEFEEPPSYSGVLQKLAPKAAERQSLLRGYFEGTAEEQAEGVKTPTEAHRAIANLVANGWIRVIITTNFDRLLEVSLTDAGVIPVVIATPDQAIGAPPLAHCECVVIKVHGDYLDTRIKNSVDELASFDESMNRLLDQVLDEYGLIVCGWSGEHDVALRDAIFRSRSRRYTTYWCHISSPTDGARSLIAFTNANTIQISNADSLFSKLADRVDAIQRIGERHPLESRVAVETLKRYLAHEQHRIRLRELVRDTTEQLVSDIHAQAFSVQERVTDEELVHRTQQFEVLSEVSVTLIANGCYWGEREHDDAWLAHIRRLANFEVPDPGKVVWLNLFRYPLLMNLYCAGISAIAIGRHDLLASILLENCHDNRGLGPQPIVQYVSRLDILPDHGAQCLLSDQSCQQRIFKTPTSLYLYRRLRVTFADLIPSDREYQETFDRFEYMASLICQDVAGHPFANSCFMWRDLHGNQSLPKRVNAEIEAAKGQWPLLRAGLFGNSYERLLEVKRAIDKISAQIGFW